jgi:hypothetical protein
MPPSINSNLEFTDVKSRYYQESTNCSANPLPEAKPLPTSSPASKNDSHDNYIAITPTHFSTNVYFFQWINTYKFICSRIQLTLRPHGSDEWFYAGSSNNRFMRLVGPLNLSGRYAEEENVLALSGIESRPYSP